MERERERERDRSLILNLSLLLLAWFMRVYNALFIVVDQWILHFFLHIIYCIDFDRLFSILTLLPA